MKDAGVGVLSQTCLEDCHSYVAAISIILLGNCIRVSYNPSCLGNFSVVFWNGCLAVMLLFLSHYVPPELKGILFYIQVS